MRRIEDREVWLFLDEHETHELMTHWGSKRRMRMRTDTVKLVWSREGDSPWQLKQVWVCGRRIHKQTNMTVSHTFTEHGIERCPAPEWLAALIDANRPLRTIGAAA